MKKQELDFLHEGKHYQHVFIPTKGNYWDKFKLNGNEFSVHYSAKNGTVYVYPVIFGHRDTSKIIHKTKTTPDIEFFPGECLKLEGYDILNVEIHPVIYVEVLGDTIVEATTKESEADFWSVYIHFEGIGLECIADTNTKEQAESVKRLLEMLLNTRNGGVA